MNIAEPLEKILKKFLVDKFPIVEDVSVTAEHVADSYFYNVIYQIDGDINMFLQQKLREETWMFYHLLSPSVGSGLSIIFEKS